MYSILELDVKNHLFYAIANDQNYKIEYDRKFFETNSVEELLSFLRRQLIKLNSLIVHKDVEDVTVCAKFIEIIRKIKQYSYFTEDRLTKSIEVQKKLIASVDYLKSKDVINKQSVEILSQISTVYTYWTTLNRHLLSSSYIFNSTKFDYDYTRVPEPEENLKDLINLAIETINKVLVEQENLLVYFDRDVINESIHERTSKLREELKEFDCEMWGQ